MNPDRVAFVSVKRMRRLCCAIEELARQFAPEIAALRMIVLDEGPEGGFVWGVRTEGNRFSDMWDTMLRAIHPREQGLKLTIVNALLPCHEQGKTDHL